MSLVIILGKRIAPRSLGGCFVRSESSDDFKIIAVLSHDIMHVGVQGASLSAASQIGVWLVIRALTAVG